MACVFSASLVFLLAYVILADNRIETSHRKRTFHRNEYHGLEVEARVVKNNPEAKEIIYSRVDVLAPGGHGQPNLLIDEQPQVIQYSSNLMDFGEDTSKYYPPFKQVRNSTSENEKLPVKDEERKGNRKCRGKNKERCRERKRRRKANRIRRGSHIAAVFHEYLPTYMPNRLRKIKPSLKIPAVDPKLVSLHSPTRVFIPIWDNNTNDADVDDIFDENTCVRCPVQMTLLAPRLEESVLLPVPPLSICSSLARMRGRLNLAVMSGPRPGSSLVEGVYPIEFLAWKKQRIATCRFTVTVKVLRCQEMEIPFGVFTDCTKGILWGSTCNFACITNSERIIGASSITCEQEIGNGVSWTSKSPVCWKGRDEVVEKFECKQLTEPENGMIICNGEPKNGFHKEGAVCQYVCLLGFTMVSPNPESKRPFPCKKGKWLPSLEVSCKRTHCIRPRAPRHGSVECDGTKSQLGRGAICKFNCDSGYVIPASLQYAKTISCKGHQWNTTTFPSCRRSLPPVVDSKNCQNETYVVEQGETYQLTPGFLPRFYTAEGKALTPVCTLFQKHRKLTAGVHLNQCRVSDLEIGTSESCNYHIIIRERMPPEPYPGDCSNRTKNFAGEKVQIKNARFYTAPDENGYRKTLSATCTLSEKTLAIGDHVNYCSAFDPILNISNSCVYSIKVKKKSCSKPRPVRNGLMKCKRTDSDEVYPPNTKCEILCNGGFFIPPEHRKLAKRECQTNLKWNNTRNPHCMSKFRFKLEDPSDCDDKEVKLNASSSYNFSLPRYKSAVKGGKVRIQCSLTNPLPIGNHTNFCVAVDEVSEFERSCIYEIVVLDSSSIQSPSPQTSGVPSITQKSITGASITDSPTILYSTPAFTERNSSDTDVTEWTSTEAHVTNATVTDIPVWNMTSTTDSTDNSTDQSYTSTDSPAWDVTSSVNLTDVNITVTDIPIWESTSTEDPTISYSAATEITPLGATSAKNFPITISTTDLPTSKTRFTSDINSTVSGKDCSDLTAPVNGNISCNSSNCRVICAEGFDFSTLYPILRSGTITCDRDLGLWDFQQDGLITHMPDCLRQVPPTSMEVTVKFLAGIKNCDDQDELIQPVIQEKLAETEGCDAINCHEKFAFNCSNNPERQEMALLTEWTFSVPFKPSEYEDIPIVPDAETALKKVLRKSYADVQTDKFKDEFKKLGLDLWPDTFNRSTIRLICDDRGFVPDDEFRCVHCSTETFETDGRCETCPENHYQNKTGQTECIECTETDKSNPRCQGNNELIVPECFDQMLDEWNTTYERPLFLTARNTPADVTCSALNSSIEVQIISCNAIDPETNAEAFCTFNVTIIGASAGSSDVQLNLFEDPSLLADFPEKAWWRNT